MLISGYVLGAAIAAGAILGLYGVRKEKQWALIAVSLLTRLPIGILFVCLLLRVSLHDLVITVFASNSPQLV